jgi:hypothetical protein
VILTWAVVSGKRLALTMLGVKYGTTANYLGYLLFTKLRRDRQTGSVSILAGT